MKGFIDPRDKKEFVIEWKDEDGRITEIQRFNTIITGYNAEVKINEREFNKLIPLRVKAYSSSDLGYNKPLDYFDTIPFWAFNCIPKLSRNITVNDKELYKLLYNELKDKDQFVQYLNKEIFNYIQSEIRKAKDLEAYNQEIIKTFHLSKKYSKLPKLLRLEFDGESTFLAACFLALARLRWRLFLEGMIRKLK